MANGTPEKGGRILAVVSAFVVVGGGIYVTGLLATSLLRHVILPIVSLAAGFVAARTVYRITSRN